MVEFESFAPEVAERTALSKGMRGAIARHVTRGAATPTTTLFTSCDVTAVVELLKTLVKEWRKKSVRPQFQDFVVAALGKALPENPIANSHVLDDEIVTYKTVNIGIAVAVSGGILVPVLHNANTKSLFDITSSFRSLVLNVKHGKLDSKYLSGSTFSMTSLMNHRVTHFTPILNSPEVGILGIGKIDTFRERSTAHFSLTFDHRAWDGLPAARFLDSFLKYIGDPSWVDLTTPDKPPS